MGKKYFNLKKSFYFLLFFVLLSILVFPLRLNTQTSDEIEFKLFLKYVINNSICAKDAGYNFIKKYPNSNFIPDVLYYLSFIESDYFMNIINLKKVILYYPYSIWRESSLIRMLNIYLLHNNFIQFDNWYNYYLNNFTIKNRRWEVEILNLKNLFKNDDFDNLMSFIELHLKNANNYNLLSYCIFLKSVILQKKIDIINAKKQLLVGLSMFELSNIYESYIYELYRVSFREEKPYYARLILNLKIFSTLNDSEKEEIIKNSKIKTDFKPKLMIIDQLKRDYYYISLGYSSDIDQVNEIKDSIEKIGIKVSIKKINESIYQIYIGYFHFKKEAQDILKKLSDSGFTGELAFIDYSY